MRLLPLGVGDAFTARYYSTCLAVEHDDHWILVDCPHPIQKMLREATVQAGLTLGPERIEAVVLTHLHADHCSGLESFAFFLRFVQQRKLPLYLHRDVLEELWQGHLAAGMRHLQPAVGAPPIEMHLDDYFDVHLLEEGRAVPCGPFSLECRHTLHHIPTTALRITAAGQTLGHSADTSFDPTLIEWLSTADLVVHETNHGTHTPYSALAALPAPLRQKMRLVHYPDEFDVEASVIAPLRQGELVDVAKSQRV